MPISPELNIILIASLVFFLAAFVHGTIGFGFPIVATPLLALGTDMQTAIIMTLVPTLLVNLVSITGEGNFFVALKRHYRLAMLAMIGAALGTQILIHVDSNIFKIFLALAILLYLLLDKVKIRLSWIKKFPRLAKILFGLSAGILGGLTNVMAPVLIIFGLESEYSRKDLIQASNFCFLFGKIIQITLFSSSGYFTLTELSSSIPFLTAVTLSLLIATKIKRYIRKEIYLKILKFILLSLSVTLILQSISYYMH